jgi:hypothetical protein
MPHAALTATAPADPAAVLPPPATATKPRGNPNLALAPRCGARTRAGCPCRSPAIHGKLRCRMHGGRSPGPRTPEGRDKVRAAHTIHGDAGAEARAKNHHRQAKPAQACTGAGRWQRPDPPSFTQLPRPRPCRD